MAVQLKAPKGKTRVIGVTFSNNREYLVGDYDTRGKAFEIAEGHNSLRAGPTDDMYYVYDVQGKCISGKMN